MKNKSSIDPLIWFVLFAITFAPVCIASTDAYFLILGIDAIICIAMAMSDKE